MCLIVHFCLALRGHLLVSECVRRGTTAQVFDMHAEGRGDASLTARFSRIDSFPLPGFAQVSCLVHHIKLTAALSVVHMHFLSYRVSLPTPTSTICYSGSGDLKGRLRMGGREALEAKRRPSVCRLSCPFNQVQFPILARHSPFPSSSSSSSLLHIQLPTLLANKAADAAPRTKHGSLTLKAKSRGSLSFSL